MEGWVKLHRSLENWQWYHKSKHVHVFLTLLLRATHTEHKVEDITLQPGQLITGTISLHKATKIPESTVYRILRDLVRSGEIVRKTDNKKSLITIINWHIYQDKDDKVNNKRITDEEQMDTNKNVNNENKGNNGSSFIHTTGEPINGDHKTKIQGKGESSYGGGKNLKYSPVEGLKIENELRKKLEEEFGIELVDLTFNDFSKQLENGLKVKNSLESYFRGMLKNKLKGNKK